VTARPAWLPAGQILQPVQAAPAAILVTLGTPADLPAHTSRQPPEGQLFFVCMAGGRERPALICITWDTV
jgi:hypothetical protein